MAAAAHGERDRCAAREGDGGCDVSRTGTADDRGGPDVRVLRDLRPAYRVVGRGTGEDDLAGDLGLQRLPGAQSCARLLPICSGGAPGSAAAGASSGALAGASTPSTWAS